MLVSSTSFEFLHLRSDIGRDFNSSVALKTFGVTIILEWKKFYRTNLENIEL